MDKLNIVIIQNINYNDDDDDTNNSSTRPHIHRHINTLKSLTRSDVDISFVSDQPTLRIPSGSSVRLRRHFVLIVEPVERFDREHVAGAVLNQSSGDKVKGSVFKSLVSIVDTVSVSDVLGVRAGGSTTRSKGHCSRVAVRELNVASPVAPIHTRRTQGLVQCFC